mmetsp:Transcript_38928/g.62394  ORF Transcript_38928/g.62394 Transcript_38928/m.62394 type:complete len:110 (-) Transcript_38928:735-1064(-)
MYTTRAEATSNTNNIETNALVMINPIFIFEILALARQQQYFAGKDSHDDNGGETAALKLSCKGWTPLSCCGAASAEIKVDKVECGESAKDPYSIAFGPLRASRSVFASK